jgi:primosomal protein N' (replication factor Y)
VTVQQSLLPQSTPAVRAAKVAIPLPVPEAYTYAVPASIAGHLAVGHAVTVPFHGREIVGFVLDPDVEPPPGVKLKSIGYIAVSSPLFPAALVPLFEWLARYYAFPLGEVLRAATPAAARAASRKVVRIADAAAPLLDGSAELTPADRVLLPLLERLARSVQGLAPMTLKRGGFDPKLLRQAERRGLVEVHQSQLDGIAHEKTETYFTLKSDPAVTRAAFKRPGPVRDRLIDYLDRFGPVPLSELRDAFPRCAGPLKALRTKELLDVEERRVVLDAADRAPIDPKDRDPKEPTPAQAEALLALGKALQAHEFSPFLLYGVTGSGKTEVYLQAAARALELGGTAIFLVPEIGLTPQFLARFRARFGELAVAVLHSGLTDRERFDEWMRIRHGEAKLVIGPRSAVFAPVEDLRLLVVDEEHDGSYKQEEGLRYHARDVAMVRARQSNAVCVLGSATPALETLHNAQQGKFELLRLPARVGSRRLPTVELVDLTSYPVEDPDAPAAILSPPLREAITENHAAGGQAILLLNRRGFATTVLCTDCGHHFRCPECDVSMTYHARRHQLLCHWCSRTETIPDACPSCTQTDTLKGVGRGTERLEEELLAVWPEIRFDRMDADTTRSRDAHRRILDRFRAGDVDVLVGTQMLAKGHDFPRVTLVGVLHADAALHLPDFRASERTFQLVSQVAGRAGRGERPGRVLVQTWHPRHHAIRLAMDHDFDAFAERELMFRRGLWYPPFARLTMFRVQGPNERATRDVAAKVGQAVRGAAEAAGVQHRVLGPSPAPMYRLQGKFRWQIQLKAMDHPSMSRVLHRLRGLPAQVARDEAKLVIDRDPVSML